MPATSTTSTRPLAGPFATQVKVIGGLLALVSLSPIATYIAGIGPPVAFLTDDQVVLVSLTSSLALFGLLASTSPPSQHRWALARKGSGFLTVLTLTAYVWLRSEFVVTLPEVNGSTVVIGHRYTPAAAAVRAAHPEISDAKLLVEWFACEVDDCFDSASTRAVNQALLASWVSFWLAFSSLTWTVTARRPDHPEATQTAGSSEN